LLQFLCGLLGGIVGYRIWKPVPLFNVDIDAKDASPSQVGASLSTVLMNAGFVSIYRFYEAFSATSILPMDCFQLRARSHYYPVHHETTCVRKPLESSI
jgi:hypothetical protein